MKTYVWWLSAVVLSFTVQGWAESPWTLCSAWAVGGNAQFANLCSQFEELKDLKFDFPDEIDAQANWFGATFTDGEKLGKFLILPVKEGEDFELSSYDRMLFRAKLSRNAIVQSFFPKNPRFLKMGDWLCVYHIPGNESDSISLTKLMWRTMLLWNDLVRKHRFAIFVNYPERDLLPALPQETENEGGFIKMVRKKRAVSMGDEDWESCVLGLSALENGSEWGMEIVAAEGTPTAKRFECWNRQRRPFQVDGFRDENSMVCRLPLEREAWIGMKKVNVKVGISLVPPDVRQEGKRYYFELSAAYGELDEETRKKYVMEESEESGVFRFWRPRQDESLPEEEGVPSPVERDEMNKNWLTHIRRFLDDAVEAALAWDVEKPVDVAMAYEDDVFYFACTFSNGAKNIDWSLLSSIWEAFLDILKKTPPPDPNQGGGMLEDLTFGPPTLLETDRGITFFTVSSVNPSSTTSIVWGIGGEAIYVAVDPGKPENETETETLSESEKAERIQTNFTRLKERIERSRQRAEENAAPPTTLLHTIDAPSGRTSMRFDAETEGRRVRYSLKTKNESFRMVFDLVKGPFRDFLKPLFP